jgi:hypothetical protein
MKTLLTILLTISLTCQGQDAKFLAYNVISSSLIAGIGSGIHKNQTETFGHAFINGCWKGIAGGGIQFISKRVTSEIYHRQNYWFGLQGRIINSIGNSVVYSAMMNQSITSNYQFDFGFIHYQTDFKKHNIMLNPCNLAVFSYEFFDKSNRFSIVKSIQTGTLFFDKTIDLSKSDVSFGSSIGNVMVVQKASTFKYANNNPNNYDKIWIDKYQTAAHELIHTMQFSANLNIFYLGEIQKIKHINWDIPINMLMYKIADCKGYDKNFYEKEAFRLSK